MKRALISLMLVFIAISTFAQIRSGAMTGYGSDVKQFGIGLDGELLFNDRMGLSPGVFYFFPERTNGYRYSNWELNGNFHYYIWRLSIIRMYGLAGLNVASRSVKNSNNFLSDNVGNRSEAGVNLGIGVNFNAGRIIPFTEAKYVTGDFNQFVIWLGLKFPLRD